MSISTTTRKAGPFTGNGATVSFPFAFKVFAAADVLVVRGEIATAAELPLTLGTHYSVTLNGDQNTNPGGTVNWIGTPLSSAFTLTIGSKVTSTQPATFTNLGRFYPRVLNDALDRLTIVVQQLAEEVSRSVKVGFSGLVSPDELVSTITTAASTATAGAASAAASAGAALDAITEAQDAIDAANAAIVGAVQADGSVAMTAELTLAGNAVGALGAVPKQQLDAVAARYAGKNRVINGTFNINQRAFSGGALAAGAYGHDRWKAGPGGATYTVSGEVATVTAGTLQQVIESVNVPEGGTYTLSWSGTAQARVDGGAYAASPITVTGKAAATNTTVEFDTGTVSLVQYEAGGAATTFERRLFGAELALCQRYFWALTYGIALQGYGTGLGANTFMNVPFPVRMRATPTLTSSFTGPANVNQQGVLTSSADGFLLRVQSAGPADFGSTYSAGNTATAEL